MTNEVQDAEMVALTYGENGELIDKATGELLGYAPGHDPLFNDGVDLDILTKEFSPHAIMERQGPGGKVFNYVKTDTVIRRLNQATNNNWSFRIVGEPTFLDGGTNRNGTAEQVMMVLGELTIPGHGTRQGFGVQRLPNPINNADDLLKAAAGDALKRAAVSFNVAIDLYGPNLEAEADAQALLAPIAAPQQRSAPPQPQQRGVDPASIPGVTRGLPPTTRAPQQAAPAQQPPLSQAHMPTRKTTDGDERVWYPEVLTGGNMAAVNKVLNENGVRGGNMGEAIKDVNAYIKRVHGVDKAVQGTGDWEESQYGGQYKVWPKDIANCLIYWKQQEDTGGSDEVKEAVAREPDDTFDDDIPFD